jgi:hypothetical protein
MKISDKEFYENNDYKRKGWKRKGMFYSCTVPIYLDKISIWPVNIKKLRINFVRYHLIRVFWGEEKLKAMYFKRRCVVNLEPYVYFNIALSLVTLLFCIYIVLEKY